MPQSFVMLSRKEYKSIMRRLADLEEGQSVLQSELSVLDTAVEGLIETLDEALDESEEEDTDVGIGPTLDVNQSPHSVSTVTSYPVPGVEL